MEKQALNERILSGIVFRLKLEFAAHEGCVLNNLDDEAQVFNALEGFRRMLADSLEAIEYLAENRIDEEEDVERFVREFPDNPVVEAAGNAMDDCLID